MSSVRKKVTILLSDRSAFKAAFGGSMPLDEGHLRSASYGPGAIVREGTEFSHLEDEQFAHLLSSMTKLDNALKTLYGRDRQAYLALVLPYLGDPGDPSVVETWRRKRKMEVRGRVFTIRHDRAVANHDLAIEILAEILRESELFADYPKRSTSTEKTTMDKRHDELWETYRSLRADKKSKTKAVKEAATECGYNERQAWRIVGLRESLQP